LAASSLSAAEDKDFASLSRYLAVSEPVVDRLPAHFLPGRARADIDATALHQIAVAGKLIYAHIRWLDQFSDARPLAGDLITDRPVTAHPLNGALFDLIHGTFASVLDQAMASAFFSTLSSLYVRYAASLALDTGSPGTFPSTMTFDNYASHAKARAAPVRAPVEAVLLLANAVPEEVERARFCFETSAAALQFLDDALDIEEDYEDRRLSWAVHRTLTLCREAHAPRLPDPDLFYKTALSEGVIVENLLTAEDLFRRSAVSAEDLFPSWENYSYQMCADAERLRTNFQRFATSHD
jgi:hypothetical protein